MRPVSHAQVLRAGRLPPLQGYGPHCVGPDLPQLQDLPSQRRTHQRHGLRLPLRRYFIAMGMAHRAAGRPTPRRDLPPLPTMGIQIATELGVCHCANCRIAVSLYGRWIVVSWSRKIGTKTLWRSVKVITLGPIATSSTYILRSSWICSIVTAIPTRLTFSRPRFRVVAWMVGSRAALPVPDVSSLSNFSDEIDYPTARRLDFPSIFVNRFDWGVFEQDVIEQVQAFVCIHVPLIAFGKTCYENRRNSWNVEVVWRRSISVPIKISFENQDLSKENAQHYAGIDITAHSQVCQIIVLAEETKRASNPYHLFVGNSSFGGLVFVSVFSTVCREIDDEEILYTLEDPPVVVIPDAA